MTVHTRCAVSVLLIVALFAAACRSSTTEVTDDSAGATTPQPSATARVDEDPVAGEQDDEEDVLFPPWASQWSAYGYADLVPIGISDEQAAYVDDLINRFGAIMRGGAQQRSGGIADWVRTGSARGSGFGTILEATAAMNRLARAEPQFAHYQEELEDRLWCVAGLVVTGQQTADQASTYPNPELVEGAWFVDDLTRMDDQQHHLSGLLATRAFLSGEDF